LLQHAFGGFKKSTEGGQETLASSSAEVHEQSCDESGDDLPESEGAYHLTESCTVLFQLIPRQKNNNKKTRHFFDFYQLN